MYINGFPSPVLNDNVYKIESGQTNTSALWAKSCYESNMKDSRVFPFGKTMIYIFDAAVLESTPWDTVKARNMYLKRYDLTLKDLQDRNWTITYP